MRISDWSSDVCSSDLAGAGDVERRRLAALRRRRSLAPDRQAARRTEDAARNAAQRRFLARQVRAALGVLRSRARRKAAGDLRRSRDAARRQGDEPGGLLAGLADRGRPARSEEHTSELQSLMRISYAVFCLKKKNK